MVKTRHKLNLREGEEKRLGVKISESPHLISNYRRLARLLARRKRPGEAEGVLKMALKQFSEERKTEKKELLKQLARIYEDAGDQPRAIRIYRKLTREHPEDFVPFERLSRIYKKTNRKKDLVNLLRTVGEDSPNRERALKSLVSLYKESGEFRPALRCQRMLVEKYGQDNARLKELGRLYEKLGHPRQAITCYRKARSFKPDRPEAVMLLGLCLRRIGAKNQARRVYRELIGIKHGFYGGHIQLAEMDIEDGRLDEAEEHLRRIEARWPGNSRVKINRAHILIQRGKPEEALELARDGLAASPFYYTDEISLGHEVLAKTYRQLGEEEESRYHGLMARKVKGSSDLFKSTASLIDELIEKTELEMGLKVIDGLLERFPGNSLASLKKAEIFRIQGRENEALSLAEKASRESNPRYLQDKIAGLKLMSELYEEKGLSDKARLSSQQASLLAGKK